ncbi:SGNH hydrolase domain-containing protein [Actinomadura sp. DC4]|uniref:SGNH hydrolase domain-containing protein n=1 Tax=Actinomadura sp. DC4 TaxID=3055069 RepID=UPI0025B1AC9F|nr:SGNH hydrolase domain-containing protein [Actinomadura sp. DC4]MDN3358943.1 SGNH hydrolase domain-containing protein [Actinomadura sp. DC4]
MAPVRATAEPVPPRHMNLPKPTPAGGDTRPFIVTGSSSAPSAPTVAVIGDSVARDYAYYLARRLGPRGVRVIDGALTACPVGTLPLVAIYPDGDRRPLRGGECPRLVAAKQAAMTATYAPKLVLWESVTEIRGILLLDRYVPPGSDEWRRRVLAEWDDALRRVTARGAKVVVILPLWYEHAPAIRLDAPGPSVEKIRDLYLRWAASHRDRVSLVDPAPVVCPSGPPCGLVNGVDFRPDTIHFDDPGGVQVADYLIAHVPELARLAAGR